jgi:hypothetical protein
MTHILFVDFDGVLHPAAAHFDLETVHVLPVQLLAAGLFVHTKLLAKLLAPCPAVGMVVHSSWRLTHTDAEILALLGPAGGHCVGVTDRELAREKSVQEFARRHGLAPGQYRVLDDQPELMPQPVALGVVISCDSKSGVADSAARAGLVAWLESGQ